MNAKPGLRRRAHGPVWSCAVWAAAGLAGAVSPACHAANAFDLSVLVANSAVYHPTVLVDPELINPWGIALRPPGAGGHIWISNAGFGSSTTYIGDVGGTPLYQDGLKSVHIDTPAFTDHGYSQVTGQVYNAASDIAGQPVEFFVAGPADNWATTPPTPVGTDSGAAKFVFVTKDGTINAWRTNTASGMTSAVVVKDYSITSTTPLGLPQAPVYTGVAMTTAAFTLNAQGQKVADNRLYVADFQNQRIQTFDNRWNDISTGVSFARPAGMPGSFSPFNVQALGDRLYVTYAEVQAQGEEPGEEVDGPGLGRVAAYDRDGHLLLTFADAGHLNAPWGLAIAPAGFGDFGGDLLVGNFGDGTIAVFDPQTGAYLGALHDADGKPIAIDGLWGLSFGNGVSLGDAHALYFTAGPDNEEGGVFGRLNLAAVPEPASALLWMLGLAGTALIPRVRAGRRAARGARTLGRRSSRSARRGPRAARCARPGG
jgi:uncharacterized protein (TIGR03118 family)